MANVKKAVFLSVGEKAIVFVIQFVSSVVLARLLSPEEIGIFSIGSLILALSHAVRDLGITSYLIQERDLTPKRLQTAATIAVIVSWTAAVVTWVVAAPIAAFYREEGIGQVMHVLSINFFLLPFGSVSMAILKRNLNFDKILRINLASSALQAAVSIGLCSIGVGFIGLAWGAVASTTLTVIMTVMLTKYDVPIRIEFSEWRHILRTGGRFCGSSLLWEFGLSAPEMIVGKAMSIETAGYLARSLGVVGLAFRSIMEGLTPVLMPAFARTHRDGESVGDQFLKSICYLSALAFPLFACMALAMDSIVLLLYGDQWARIIEPARILCVGSAALTIAVTGAAMVSGTGKSKYTLRFQLVGQPIKVVLILLASAYSLDHVTAGIAIGDLVMTVYTLLVLRRLFGIELTQVGAAIGPSVLVALSASASCLAFKLAFAQASPFFGVVGCILASSVGWVVGVMVTRHPVGVEVGAVVRRLSGR
ncbi:lipopolysaccharide biosynthesis protein [Zoogloea sp.]|uniref:lipopolysaccharide biosynthesis protein n=1 Tax=Zoogloea sp. TaxID=49181 RepID=UPI0035B22BF9